MKKKLIGLNYRGKKRNVEVDLVPFWFSWLGLMFKRRETAKILIFDFFKKDIRVRFHSLFVFFPFYILWLDKDNKILEFRKVRPFDPCILPSVKFRKIIEIPINKKYDGVIKYLVEERNL